MVVQDKSGVAQDKPSEVILKKAFAAFGDIRMVDIPMLDPYRHKVLNLSCAIPLIEEMFIEGSNFAQDSHSLNTDADPDLFYLTTMQGFQPFRSASIV